MFAFNDAVRAFLFRETRSRWDRPRENEMDRVSALHEQSRYYSGTCCFFLRELYRPANFLKRYSPLYTFPNLILRRQSRCRFQQLCCRQWCCCRSSRGISRTLRETPFLQCPESGWYPVSESPIRNPERCRSFPPGLRGRSGTRLRPASPVSFRSPPYAGRYTCGEASGPEQETGQRSGIRNFVAGLRRAYPGHKGL